jgi:hypothetical protein
MRIPVVENTPTRSIDAHANATDGMNATNVR